MMKPIVFQIVETGTDGQWALLREDAHWGEWDSEGLHNWGMTCKRVEDIAREGWGCL